MRRVLLITYALQLGSSAFILVVFEFDLLSAPFNFALFIVWAIGLFAMMGTTMGNLNALVLEPLGHIAGLVASVMSSISTVISVLIAIPVGLSFNGTPLPLIAAVTICRSRSATGSLRRTTRGLATGSPEGSGLVRGWELFTNMSTIAKLIDHMVSMTIRTNPQIGRRRILKSVEREMGR
jgi:hypothetical protein